MTAGPRRVVDAELAPLAQLWHDGWHRAHAAHVSAELTALRTIADFTGRLPGLRDALRVIGPPGEPQGLCAVRGDELYQMYAARAAQGSGVATALLQDGEARIAAAGHCTAWLVVVPENARAIAFYTRQGWRDAGMTDAVLDTATGTYTLPLLKMTKALTVSPWPPRRKFPRAADSFTTC